jgi:hypothetical protein
MPLAQYGTTSPAGLDPWPIESVLAPGAAAGSSANQQLMLSDYQYQREAANNLYGQDMAAQHDFAKQQLAATIADQRAKNLQGFIKEPGGLAIAAASPEYSSLLGDADPRVVQGVIGQQTRLQDATVAEKGGAGTWSLTNAGFTPATQDVANLTGLQVAKGLSIPEKVANIKLQGDLAHASASRGPKFTVPLKVGQDDQGHDISINVPIPQNASDAEMQAILANAKRAAANAYPPGTGVAGTVGLGDGGGAPPARPPLQSPNVVNRGSAAAVQPPPPTTGLKPNTTDTTRKTTTQTLVDPQTQAQAKQALSMSRRLTPADKRQILDNSGGGTVLPVQRDAGGKFFFVGRDGKPYYP